MAGPHHAPATCTCNMHLQCITQLLTWHGSLQATDLEVNMNAVERMVEYTSQPTEGSSQKSAWPPPRDWPHAGGIVIDNLQVVFLQLLSSVEAFQHLPHQSLAGYTVANSASQCAIVQANIIMQCESHALAALKHPMIVALAVLLVWRLHCTCLLASETKSQYPTYSARCGSLLCSVHSLQRSPLHRICCEL